MLEFCPGVEGGNLILRCGDHADRTLTGSNLANRKWLYQPRNGSDYVWHQDRHSITRIWALYLLSRANARKKLPMHPYFSMPRTIDMSLLVQYAERRQKEQGVWKGVNWLLTAIWTHNNDSIFFRMCSVERGCISMSTTIALIVDIKISCRFGRMLKDLISKSHLSRLYHPPPSLTCQPQARKKSFISPRLISNHSPGEKTSTHSNESHLSTSKPGNVTLSSYTRPPVLCEKVCIRQARSQCT